MPGHQEQVYCTMCGKAMRTFYIKGERIGRGYLGRGTFCSLTCGYKFAMRTIHKKGNA